MGPRFAVACTLFLWQKGLLLVPQGNLKNGGSCLHRNVRRWGGVLAGQLEVFVEPTMGFDFGEMGCPSSPSMGILKLKQQQASGGSKQGIRDSS